MAFSGGGLAQSSSGSSVADIDDGEEQVEDLNGAVEEQATYTPRVSEEQQALLTDGTTNAEYTPQARLRAVGQRSSEYEREYRLQLLHRLLLRNLPLDEIA